MAIKRIKKNIHKGERCFILGTGPGLNDLDLSFLEDEITIGMNTILRKEDVTPNYIVIADTIQLEGNWNTIWDKRMLGGHYVVNTGCNMRGTKKHDDLSGMCKEGRGSTCSDRFYDKLPDEYDIHPVRHEEKSGAYQTFFVRDPPNQKDKIIMTRLDEYYMDPYLKTISGYGCSSMDALAIPTAVFLGCKEIYMIGTDRSRCHFYDSRPGSRHIEFTHVLPILKKKGVKLYNADPANAFPEVEYKKYEDLFKSLEEAS